MYSPKCPIGYYQGKRLIKVNWDDKERRTPSVFFEVA